MFRSSNETTLDLSLFECVSKPWKCLDFGENAINMKPLKRKNDFRFARCLSTILYLLVLMFQAECSYTSILPSLFASRHKQTNTNTHTRIPRTIEETEKTV